VFLSGILFNTYYLAAPFAWFVYNYIEKDKEFRSEENARENADVEMNPPEDKVEEKSGRKNLGECNTVGDDNGEMDKNARERSSENTDCSGFQERSKILYANKTTSCKKSNKQQASCKKLTSRKRKVLL